MFLAIRKTSTFLSLSVISIHCQRQHYYKENKVSTAAAAFLLLFVIIILFCHKQLYRHCVLILIYSSLSFNGIQKRNHVYTTLVSASSLLFLCYLPNCCKSANLSIPFTTCLFIKGAYYLLALHLNLAPYCRYLIY